MKKTMMNGENDLEGRMKKKKNQEEEGRKGRGKDG